MRNFVWEKNHRQINHATFYCATAWNVQPRKSQKLRQKDSQQIVESFSHRALFLWTACVCSTEIENENRFCLVNVHQIWNQLLCNQVSQMFLLLMTPSSSLQLILLRLGAQWFKVSHKPYFEGFLHVRNVNTFTHAKYFSRHINSKSHLIVNVART